MKEYIEKDLVMDALLHERYGYCCEDAINKIPAADVVEVVRCTKCKHWLPGTILTDDTFEPPYCLVHKAPMHGDDYCSYGERKGGDK